MTRNEVIKEMMAKATELTRNYTWDGYADIFTMCNDWNSEHEDEEIFMCDHVNEETGYVDGFYIEDDYWIFE